MVATLASSGVRLGGQHVATAKRLFAAEAGRCNGAQRSPAAAGLPARTPVKVHDLSLGPGCTTSPNGMEEAQSFAFTFDQWGESLCDYVKQIAERVAVGEFRAR